MDAPTSNDLIHADGAADSSLSKQSPKTQCKDCQQLALANMCSKVEMGFDLAFGQYYAKYHCPNSDTHIHSYSDGFIFDEQIPAPHGL